MDVLEKIPIELWVSLISAFVVLYTNPPFITKRKRDLLEYKLKNIYAPLRYTLKFYKLLDNESFISATEESFNNIVKQHYAYIPEQLLNHLYTFLSTQSSWPKKINSYKKIEKIVINEEYFCQKKLKLNELYIRDKTSDSFFVRCFYKFYNPLFPFFWCGSVIVLVIFFFEILINKELIATIYLLIILCVFVLAMCINLLIQFSITSRRISQLKKTDSNPNPF